LLEYFRLQIQEADLYKKKKMIDFSNNIFWLQLNLSNKKNSESLKFHKTQNLCQNVFHCKYYNAH
jgi:predicted CoA-binding protein